MVYVTQLLVAMFAFREWSEIPPRAIGRRRHTHRIAAWSVYVRLSEMPQLCAVCGIVASQRCGRCKSAWYCSVEHQRQDWTSAHKVVCGTAKLTKTKRKAQPVPLRVTREHDATHGFGEFMKCTVRAKPGDNFSNASLIAGDVRALSLTHNFLKPLPKIVSSFFNDLSMSLNIEPEGGGYVRSVNHSTGEIEAYDDHGEPLTRCFALTCDFSAPEVYERMNKGAESRNVTAEEFQMIAYPAPTISFHFGMKTFKAKDPDRGFTVQELIKVILAFERRQRIGDGYSVGDLHHIFFEGLHKRSDGSFDIHWGS